MNKNDIIRDAMEELITTIEKELNQSLSAIYKCEDNSVISTDVGYVEEWFNEYKYVIRERYCS